MDVARGVTIRQRTSKGSTNRLKAPSTGQASPTAFIKGWMLLGAAIVLAPGATTALTALTTVGLITTVVRSNMLPPDSVPGFPGSPNLLTRGDSPSKCRRVEAENAKLTEENAELTEKNEALKKELSDLKVELKKAEEMGSPEENPGVKEPSVKTENVSNEKPKAVAHLVKKWDLYYRQGNDYLNRQSLDGCKNGLPLLEIAANNGQTESQGIMKAAVLFCNNLGIEALKEI